MIQQDYGCMTPAQEQVFDKRVESYFRGHRQCPNGRNPRFWEHSESSESRQAFTSNYDKIKWHRNNSSDTGARLQRNISGTSSGTDVSPTQA